MVVLNPWGKPRRLRPEFVPRIQDDHGLERHKNPKIDIPRQVQVLNSPAAAYRSELLHSAEVYPCFGNRGCSPTRASQDPPNDARKESLYSCFALKQQRPLIVDALANADELSITHLQTYGSSLK